MIDIRERWPRCARGGPACWTRGSRRVRFPGLRGCGRAGRSQCWFRWRGRDGEPAGAGGAEPRAGEGL